MRHSHYWWTATGRRYPSRIAVLDCDTARPYAIAAGGVQNGRLASWCLISAGIRRGVCGPTPARTGDLLCSLWEQVAQLLHSKERTWLFVPDCGRTLPLIGFWDMLEGGILQLYGRDWHLNDSELSERERKEQGICVVDDPPTLIVCQMAGRPGTLTVLDVQNWGLELEPSKVACAVRAERYFDAIRSVVSTLRQNWSCSLRATAASQAVSALRTLPECRQLHCHTHTKALALERAAIYGGRCEAYRLGEIPGEVYHLDVRSMYPALCLDLPVPISLKRYFDDSRRARLSAGDRPESHIADVEIGCTDPDYPYRNGEHTIYPVGRYRTTLAGPELARAVRQGVIARWHSAAEYTCAPALRSYFELWFRLLVAARSSGETQLAGWIKRVMNGVIGKFAERGRTWNPCSPLTEMGPYGRWMMHGADGTDTRYRNIAWNTQRETVDGESNWSVPAINAYVTSAGRVYLHDLMERAGQCNTWYVDTDALICTGAGFDNLLRGGLVRDGEAGYLRLIGRHKRCVVYGIRHYQLDSEVICAGVPVGEIGPGETRAAYWQRQRIRDEIHLGCRPAGRVVAVPLPTALDYRHGRVMSDGRVLPWEIDQCP